MKKMLNFILAVVLALGAFTSLPATPAHAATLKVTNTNDSGSGSLRQALSTANDGDTIDLTGVSGTIALTSNELPIYKNLTLIGPGAAKLTISGNNARRALYIYNGKNVSISGVTIANGLALTGEGGGIYLSANLTLDNVIVSNNSAAINGGGIYTDSASKLTMTNSKVINNLTAGNGGGIAFNGTNINLDNVVIGGNTAGTGANTGGGIYINSNATSAFFNDVAITNNQTNGSSGGGLYSISSLTIFNSLIANNLASGNGGGLSLQGSGKSYILANVTISGNRSDNGSGGGIYNTQNLTMSNATITGNVADNQGGGLAGNAINVLNTIIAGNSAREENSEDCFGTLNSGLGHNLIQFTTGCTLTGVTDGNITGQNALLNPLANNGGKTMTHSLQVNSPAIDAGYTGENCPGLDQRGYFRPQDGNGDGNKVCDIGAYEVLPTSTFKSAATPDGWVLESDENSSAGGTLNKGGKTLLLGDDAANKQYRAILSFNTASLPDDADITKVTLKVRRKGVTGGGNPVTTFGGFMVDIKKGNFGTAGLQLADFSTKGSKTYGAFKPKADGSGWYTINLTSGGNQINKFGNTQIRLRFKTDDNNNFIANFLSIHSGNAASASKPQLIVEFSTP